MNNILETKEWLKDKVVIYESFGTEGCAGFPQPWGWLYKEEYDKIVERIKTTPLNWNIIPQEIQLDTQSTKLYIKTK